MTWEFEITGVDGHAKVWWPAHRSYSYSKSMTGHNVIKENEAFILLQLLKLGILVENIETVSYIRRHVTFVRFIQKEDFFTAKMALT